MGKYLFLIWKNLRRNKRRTALTVLSSGVSVFLIGALVSVYALMFAREASEDSALRLITRHKVSLGQELPLYYGPRIQSVDGVETLSVMNWFGGIYKDQRPENMFARFAVDPEEIFNIYSEFVIPPEQLEAFQRDRQGLAVGKSVADRLGFKIGDRITLQGDIYPFDPELTVRAIFEGRDDEQAFFHFKYLEESLPGRGVGIFAIRLRSADDASSVAVAVDEMFRNAPSPTKTETEAAFQMSFVSQLGNIKLFLMSIAGAIVFTMLMVSANTVAMSVRERTREVGVLKTLGFTSRSVLGLILGEAVAIALLGGVVGVAVTLAVTALMRDAVVQFFTGFELPVWGVALCFAMAIAVGLVSSAVPALIAARTNICEALRHSG